MEEVEQTLFLDYNEQGFQLQYFSIVSDTYLTSWHAMSGHDITISNFFLGLWAGKMNRFLQSDWFWERAEFSDLDRGQRNGPAVWQFLRDETNEPMELLLSKIRPN